MAVVQIERSVNAGKYHIWVEKSGNVTLFILNIRTGEIQLQKWIMQMRGGKPENTVLSMNTVV